MAATEFGHFQRLRDRLVSLGVNPMEAMRPFQAPLDAFHDQTAPSDWLEGLVKAYVGDGMANDFYREVAAYVDADTRALVLEVFADAGQADFVVDRVRAAIEPDPKVGGRLALWGRRLVGEALSQAQRIAADRDALTALLDRQRGPAGPRPGRDRPDVHPAHRGAHAADERPRPAGLRPSGCSAGSCARPRDSRTGRRPGGDDGRFGSRSAGQATGVVFDLPVTIAATTTRTAATTMLMIQRIQSIPFGLLDAEGSRDVVADQDTDDAADDREPQRDVVPVSGGHELAEQADDDAGDDDSDDIHGARTFHLGTALSGYVDCPAAGGTAHTLSGPLACRTPSVPGGQNGQSAPNPTRRLASSPIST